MGEKSSVYDWLEQISSNMWWAWHPEVLQLFREIDPDAWRATNHNPVQFLRQIDRDQLEARAHDRALGSRVRHAHQRLSEYVANDGPTSMEISRLRTAPVAYFCAEFGIHESLPIYSGGLGILAGDHLKASSDLGIPIVGIGLFYVMGYFEQRVDKDGWQTEHYGRVDIKDLPIQKVLDDSGAPVEVSVEASDGTIRAQIWRVAVGRNQLLLLDADVEGNKESDRTLTHTLYGGDRRIRIRQELLLGVGGMRALEKLNIRPGVYHLNEGHSAFAPLEAARQYMEEEGLDFSSAVSRVSKRTVFTTHTPVPAGHDRFTPELFEETMGPLREQLGLDHHTFHGLGRLNQDDPHEPFCMTVLALKMSDHRNGVSHIHGRVSRAMWDGLWPHTERQSIPIRHITNGVHVGSFLAPQMRLVYDRYLDRDWQDRMHTPEAWAPLADVDPGQLWETHQMMKSRLISFVHRRVAAAYADRPAPAIMPGSGLGQDVLTLGFARRFATYKRANLIMADLERFRAMIADADRPLQIIYAGKSHPADDLGKGLIQNIVKLTADPAFEGRVVFLENYDANIARYLVRGVDVWLNNPRRPLEACGTSGQKTVLNGALNCSILDGWWAEAYDGRNGFAIGQGQEFPDPARQDEHDERALYEVLEREVIPLYYDRDERGLPLEWIERMKWAILSLGWRFNANRMVLDYMRSCYLPASGATTCGFE